MKRFFTLLLLLTIAFIKVKAQDIPDPTNFSRLTEVLNPSPEAASLGKYGGIPVNLSSGSLNLEIPVYNYLSHNLSIPISLIYNSNCIRVNDIAPSVGMSWALNAGGVITHTVFGMPDDFKPRLSAPSTFPSRDTSYINWLYNLGTSSRGVFIADGQPDLFSFNFGSQNGKFILDSTLSVAQLLTYSGLKIDCRFTASDSNYNFKITGLDGIQYYFGGAAIERTESQEYVNTGSMRNHIPPSVTSYYLYKIIHPDHDTINISYMQADATYIDNISETMYGQQSIGENGACNVACPAQAPTNSWIKAYNTCTSQGVLIQQITSSGGARLVFNYIPRKDYPEPLLSSINVYQPNSTTPVKVFHLNYQYAVASGSLNSYQTDSSFRYRPFLTGVVESSPDSGLTKSYHFNYNDINALPPRLSYAQDHYGFYNGQTTNSSLLPVPTVNHSWLRALPMATANREIDSNYCLKGLLTNIVYPTGGQDSVVYEPNYVYGQVTVTNPSTTVTASAVGNGRFGTPVYDTVVLAFGQTIQINASCFYTQNPPSNPDPAHDQAALSLTCIAGSFIGQIFLQQPISPGSTYNSLGDITLNAGTYVLKLQASGTQVAAESSLTYIPGAESYVYKNTPIGGNRVKKIISIDPINNNSNIKRYFYGPLNAIDQSSSVLLYSPIYERPANFYYDCRDYNGFPLDYTVQQWVFPCEYSNSQSNLCAYSSSPVSYAAVTESFGENFENGGVEHDFTQFPDLPGEAFQGDFVLSAPRTSYSYLNGRETCVYTFKNGGQNFVPVKKVFTNYKQDSRRNLSVSSYVDIMNYVPISYFNPPNDIELGGFNLTIYKYQQNWLYADTVRTVTYDQAGVNYSSDTLITQYNNPVHGLPTTISQSASDGRSRSATIFYPLDITLSGTAETARQALVAGHMFAPVLKSQIFRGSNQTYVETTDFYVFPAGDILPQTRSLQVGLNPVEKRVEFYRYNQFGKPLEQSKENDVKQSYVYGYNQLYPIAQVINADSASIAYTGFEADGSGGWTIGSGQYDSTTWFEGHKSFLCTASISRSGLDSSKTYMVTYWTRNGQPFTIPGTMTGFPVSGKTINIGNGSWTLYEHKISGQTIASVGATGEYIDCLRLFPVDAQMTSYTYSPLVGITSSCSPDNKVTYYEYDGLGRLSVVKDQDGNIIKTFDYHYAGQQN